MADIVTVSSEGVTLDMILFRRYGRPGNEMFDAVFAANPALASQPVILPVGLNGLIDVFPKFRKGKRAQVTLNIGKPFGPFYVSYRGETDRVRLEEIGHEIMRRVANLVSPQHRGFYSEDPGLREAARGTEIYPWAGNPEI